MRVALCFCVLLALSALGTARLAAQQPQPEVWVIDRDPGPGVDLATGDGLYVRLGYRSDRPLRFRMEGLAQGKNITAGAMYNVAPVYPAGTGETIVWLAYRTPGAIDEIKITVMAADWKPVATITQPVQIGWNSGLARRPQAAWVESLNRQQQDMATRSMAPREDTGGDWLFTVLPLGVLAYFLLQPWTIMRFESGWRIAAFAPLLVTVPLLLHAIVAFAAGANLWPLLVLFGLPLATTYLLLLAGVRFLVREATA